MKTLYHLNELSNFMMDASELSHQSINKVKTTAEYSIKRRQDQDINYVTRRCLVATMAEQKVAEHMQGYVMDNTIDFSDPFTYAFDVLSGIEFYGARIEVKTHQTNARWISVNLDERNDTGHMNLYHFLNYEVADYITIFNSKSYMNNTYNFVKAFVGTKNDIKKVIKRSQYNGWYLHI